MLAFLLSAFSVPGDKKPKEKTFVVVLDAGHGGHDPGNLGNGYLEKNIALNIVLNVGKSLEKNPNVKVVYTRKDDTFVDLYVRGQIANKADADLFVSVHCDSHNSDAHGAGTFVLGLHANKQNFEIAKKENSAIYLEDDYETRYAGYDINSPESVIGFTIMQEEFLDQSIALAKLIQDNFTKKLKRVDRKVKQAGFIVLHQTFMPSVLVETGFLTNKTEGAYLNSGKGQTEMGSAIAAAILDYKNTLNGNTAMEYVKKETPNVAVATKEQAKKPIVVPKKELPKEEMVRVIQVVSTPEKPKETADKSKESPAEPQ
ncbi:MAG: N-acetylmuramoyl-L-alanine amidase family protein, partial [Flavobacteriales bacterium]